MQSNQIEIDNLELERKSLSESARLRWFHWTVIVLSLLLTLGAWYFSHSQVKEKQKTNFEREANQVVQLVKERMRQYEDALWGGVATIKSSGGKMDYTQWQTFANSLQIVKRYPGINGIGVIHQVTAEEVNSYLAAQRIDRPGFRIHPEHTGTVKMPITYIEPQADNMKAVGLDIAHEVIRHQAALRAGESGVAQITGPIVLVQDASRTPGFLFFAPFYSGGSNQTAKDRLDNFVGMVYAPFVVNKLMEGTLDKSRRQIGVRITDGTSVMYDEHVDSEHDFDENPLHTSQYEVNFYGRAWVFDIWSTNSFRVATSNSQPLVILIGGLLIDTLLALFFLMLCRSNRRALVFTDRMTNELRNKADALAESNAELETFAYVTSHDLKTPLRGIGDLTDYLEEDLGDYFNGNVVNPDVKHNIGRLRTQVQRMENLIGGILDYSSLTNEPDTVEMIALPLYLASLRAELGLKLHQLVIDSSCPSAFPTHATRLMQVLANLVGNACKYHHDPENAVITVSANSIGNYYRFSVSDNGPGIDPKFHARIFEVFQSLQSKDEVESNGVGLSIVKKIVESYRGNVHVDSVVGFGTVFSFDWPKEMPVTVLSTARAS